MEIRDPIHGSLYFSDSEVAVLDSLVFQRLRSIKQLGFAEFSFPGATHSRYLHSAGVSHLAAQCFDSIFRAFPFSKNQVKIRLRNCLRLAALLHDIGHGPLSHTTELVMPRVEELELNLPESSPRQNRKANHEDYTLRFVTNSEISRLIQVHYSDVLPKHVACLIDRSLICDDDFFIDNNIDFRPLLSQIVSSELDADRMDYLERDSYFCGTNYGKIDHEWLIQNLTLHIKSGQAFLALNRRALYAFDDFLISRHHMHLMVYFHHKSIIYEEMLNRYLTSADCQFHIPANIDEYINFNDYKLHEHLASVKNNWARRVSERRPYRVLIELHNSKQSDRPEKIRQILEAANIDSIHASSKARLSKYHSSRSSQDTWQIFVVDQYDHRDEPSPIGDSTEIFSKYEGARVIDRIYVAPENFVSAKLLLQKQNP